MSKMTEIHLTLPIYYTKEFKRKKDKTFMVGMNWYRNAHWIIESEVKQYYHNLVKIQLDKQGWKRINGKYQIQIKYYYKNIISDAMNVISIIDKYVNDALQEFGVVENDNVQYYSIPKMIKWPEKDIKNPRVELIIKNY